MKKTLAIILTVLVLLSACGQKPPALNETQVWELVSQAYSYVFPLVIMDATQTASTNTEAPVQGSAPVNQFIHAQKLADASFKTVVTPNVDTVYTQAWLDLSQEPMVYVMPQADRFFQVQVLDAWTNTTTVLKEPGAYAFVLPGWEGELPADVRRVEVSTAMVWTIARIILDGPEDLPNVYAIQNEMRLLPLSAYVSGGDYNPPKGSYNAENDFVPVEKVLSMGPKAFFDRANALMQENPPAQADAALLEKLAAIHVGPGMEFDTSLLSGDIAAQWKQMLQQLRTTLTAAGAAYAVPLGQWRYFGAPIGDFGVEYTYRAMVALGGLGANTLEVAVYPRTSVDSTGAALDGSKTYVLHFSSLPPTLAGGFWSVTAYGSDDFLMDNPIDRYCINDRTDFQLNADGSLDIILSATAPENIANWLPISADTFHLYMRIYVPDMEALKTWEAPTVTVLENP